MVTFAAWVVRALRTFASTTQLLGGLTEPLRHIFAGVAEAPYEVESVVSLRLRPLSRIFLKVSELPPARPVRLISAKQQNATSCQQVVYNRNLNHTNATACQQSATSMNNIN